MSSLDTLAASLSPEASLVTPASQNYKESIRRWSDAAEKPASVVAFPTSADDVSKIIIWSKANGLDIAVCGGGHAVSGSSSTDGGVCIDLSKMQNVVVNSDSKTITAQGGAFWEHVDTAAAEYDLAAVGGTVNHTGIGGLALGGGHGWLTGLHGLVVDNLLSVEMVLADGSIITVSSTQNPDLFWAIRGAGACFGVVTSFTFQGHEQRDPIWGGTMVFPPNQLHAVIDFSNQLMETTNGQSAVMIAFASPPPTKQPSVITVVFHNGPEDEAKKTFEPLISLGPIVNKTSMMPYKAANTMLNGVAGHGGRKSQQGAVFIPPLDPKLAETIFNDCASFVKSEPGAAKSMILLEYHPFKKLMEAKQTDTAFANRGAYCNIVVVPNWVGQELDNTCRSWARTTSAKLKAEFEKKKAEGTDDNTMRGVGAYANYSDGIGYRAKTLFGVNAERLVELKKQFDPENVFNKYCNLLA